MKFNLCLTSIVAVLFATLLFSCTTDLELPQQQRNFSSSGMEKSSSSSLPAGMILCLYGNVCKPLTPEMCLDVGEEVESCPLDCPAQTKSNYFTDPRDCNEYEFETAPNGEIWMSENLNYSRNNTLGYCYGVEMDGENPHEDGSSCNRGYGRLYEYATAIDGNSPQGLCPSGWHIPSREEWDPILKSKMSTGFYIYPGNNYNLTWRDRDKCGFYWTRDGSNYFTFFTTSNGVARNDAASLEYFSVRCIKD